MDEKDREIYLLKKQIENRESTISFLNEIIDAQSESLGILKEKLSAYEDESNERLPFVNALIENNEELEEEIRLRDGIIDKLKQENELLKSKLELLFKAFDFAKELSTRNKTEKTSNKEKHDKELESKQWKKKREEVFERYGKQCVECGSTRNLQVHHLVYRKDRHLWEYNVDELIPLCKKCHEKVHKDKNHKFHEKYIN